MPANVGSGVPGETLSGHRLVTSKSEANTAAVAAPNRFFGLVDMGAPMATMDVSTNVNEVTQYFATQIEVRATITGEIEARARDGIEAGLQRTINEHRGGLKFSSANFEWE